MVILRNWICKGILLVTGLLSTSTKESNRISRDRSKVWSLTSRNRGRSWSMKSHR